jgi:hypothetical protein
MASEIRVNSITNRSGLSTVTFSDTGVVISGITTITDLRASGNTIVAAGSTSAPSISPTGDSNTGIFFPSPDTIAFAEGGVEALRITSASRVGLGTNIPDSYDSGARTLVIDESGSLAGMTIRSSTQGAVYFADGLTGNEAYRGRIEYSHSTDALNFGTAGTGSKLSLTSGGDVQIANGNLVFSTSGKGIDFSATANSSGTMTSEILSDYEEGTWTPVIGGSATYGNREGRYTKIGNLVMLTGRINISSRGTGSQNEITGLPFTAASITANYGGSRAFFTSLATSVVSLTPIVEPGTTSVFFYTLSAGATASSNKTNVMGDGTIIDFNITYIAS